MSLAAVAPEWTPTRYKPGDKVRVIDPMLYTGYEGVVTRCETTLVKRSNSLLRDYYITSVDCGPRGTYNFGHLKMELVQPINPEWGEICP